ncbi:hypothetical protein [Mycolicibacterium elephantis]|uniref:hypothetical protein n=1 Tax=Mycolicibacterium elephantis TaxID=81858 RepID=UPI000AA0142A|nr:hypothetical protein [Mycolicibacterium elephantis]
MSTKFETLTDPGGGEVLLGWLDAEGSGTLDLLRRRVTWFGSGRPDGQTVPPRNAFFMWLREMSALAYLDVDFASRQWSAARTALTILPGLDGLLMVSGVRAAYLLEALEHLGFDGFAFRYTPNMGLAIPIPGTLFVQAERQSSLPQLFRHLQKADLGLVDAGCIASRLAFAVKPVRAQLRPAAPPTYDSNGGPEKLIPSKILSDTSGHPEPWIPVTIDNSTAGAYRWRRPGQLIHAIFDGKEWFSGDRSDVIHTAMSLAGRSALQWAPYKKDRLSRGSLAVHRYIDLPLVHKRAATLCTGIPSRLDGAMRVYEGVPHEIASRLAKSLGQELKSISR